MEVVLRQDVDHVGLRGEVVNVARGYARNYLLPRGLAEVATPGPRARARAARRAASARNEAKTTRRGARRSRSGSRRPSCKFEVNAGPTGSLFGSVTATNIVDRLWEEQKIRIDRRKLGMQTIKRIGRYTVAGRGLRRRDRRAADPRRARGRRAAARGAGGRRRPPRPRPRARREPEPRRPRPTGRRGRGRGRGAGAEAEAAEAAEASRPRSRAAEARGRGGSGAESRRRGGRGRGRRAVAEAARRGRPRTRRAAASPPRTLLAASRPTTPVPGSERRDRVESHSRRRDAGRSTRLHPIGACRSCSQVFHSCGKPVHNSFPQSPRRPVDFAGSSRTLRGFRPPIPSARYTNICSIMPAKRFFSP